MSKKLMWRMALAANDVFWHITHSEKADGIAAAGIELSADGQMGTGVYCIKEGSGALDSVVSLMEQRGYKPEELIVVSFMYSGPYLKHDEDEYIFSAEGWCVVPENIPRAKILTIESLSMIRSDFGYTMDEEESEGFDGVFSQAEQHAFV